MKSTPCFIPNSMMSSSSLSVKHGTSNEETFNLTIYLSLSLHAFLAVTQTKSSPISLTSAVRRSPTEIDVPTFTCFGSYLNEQPILLLSPSTLESHTILRFWSSCTSIGSLDLLYPVLISKPLTSNMIPQFLPGL